MDKKRISFLFGAGAEGRGNYDFPSGFEYMKKSIFDEDHKNKTTRALKKFFNGEYYGNGKYKYRSYTVAPTTNSLRRIVLQKIDSDKDDNFYNKYQSYVLPLFSETYLKEIRADYGWLLEDFKNPSIKQDTNNSIEEEYRDILSGKINTYSAIKSDFLKELFTRKDDDSIYIDFDCHISNLLDSYFHTIIDPSKYGSVSFSKIFNYYWQCYFAIVEGIVKLIEPENKDIKVFFDDNEKLDYYKVLSNVEQFTKLIYGFDIPYRSSYYTEINNTLKSNKFDCQGIITTNYYNLCMQAGDNVNHIFLHGQLSQFEFPEIFNVIDVLGKGRKESFDGSQLFFPFIFGQSLVKPIVHSKQVNEYSKFKKCLDRSDILVVIGYNMNSDDNHINSYLREYVMTPKKSIIVLGSTDEKTITKQTQNKLHLPLCNNIKAISVNYNDELPKTIVGKLFDFIDSIV